MTFCEELGWKVGDQFVVTNEHDDDLSWIFTKGSIVELQQDDGSIAPAFKLIEGASWDGDSWNYEYIYNVSPIQSDGDN